MYLKQAEEDGTLDQGAEVLRTEEATIMNETVVDTDPQSGAETKLVEIDTKKKVNKVTVERIRSQIVNAPRSGTGVFRGFMTLPNGKLVAAFRAASNAMSDTGIPIPRMRLVGVEHGKTTYINEGEARHRNAKQHGLQFGEDLQQIWKEEADAVPDTQNEKVFVATGQLIQNWRRLSITEAEEGNLTQADLLASVQIKRVVLSNGKQVLGRIIPERFVPSVLKEFGVSEGATTEDAKSAQPERTTHTLTSLLGEILSGEEVFLDNGWSLKTAVRSGTDVIILRRNGQANPNIISTEMTGLGLKSISAAGGLEWFVPSGDTSVLGKLLEQYNPRDVDMQADAKPDSSDDEGGTPPVDNAPPTPEPPMTMIDRRTARMKSTKKAQIDRSTIRDLDEKVEKIIGNINNVELKKRVLGIYAKIIANEQVNIIGHQAESAEEIAVLAQVMRHPLMEVSRADLYGWRYGCRSRCG